MCHRVDFQFDWVWFWQMGVYQQIWIPLSCWVMMWGIGSPRQRWSMKWQTWDVSGFRLLFACWWLYSEHVYGREVGWQLWWRWAWAIYWCSNVTADIILHISLDHITIRLCHTSGWCGPFHGSILQSGLELQSWGHLNPHDAFLGGRGQLNNIHTWKWCWCDVFSVATLILWNMLMSELCTQVDRTALECRQGMYGEPHGKSQDKACAIQSTLHLVIPLQKWQLSTTSSKVEPTAHR